MQTHFDAHHYNYSPRTHVRERPLHWLVILVSLLFIFLLVIESVAFVVLGAWHLTLPRLLAVQALSYDLFARELAFGILLVIVGSVGVVTSGLGLVAFYSLRLPLLKTVSAEAILSMDGERCVLCVKLGWCLWAVMAVGIAVGVIGITFACEWTAERKSERESEVARSSSSGWTDACRRQWRGVREHGECRRRRREVEM